MGRQFKGNSLRSRFLMGMVVDTKLLFTFYWLHIKYFYVFYTHKFIRKKFQLKNVWQRISFFKILLGAQEQMFQDQCWDCHPAPSPRAESHITYGGPSLDAGPCYPLLLPGGTQGPRPWLSWCPTVRCHVSVLPIDFRCPDKRPATFPSISS